MRRGQRYLPHAQQFHDWLLAPLEPELQALNIQVLAYIPDTGLRSLPLAAMHDGSSYAVERYSIGLVPSLALTDLRPPNLFSLDVLAMGASEFTDQPDLPAVPAELSAIADDLWSGNSFLNDNFTLDQLREARRNDAYGIIHLATHSDFQPGKPDNSYIQLWERRLSLLDLEDLGWDDPKVELLVLSACRTALGDPEAELGFAGLTIAAGVRSALGSLWYVSDAGTLGLMAKFYEQLQTAPIKAEAVRRAQLAMMRGEVRVEDGELLLSDDRRYPLPSEFANASYDFTHPYYWSGFTLIGNPW